MQVPDLAILTYGKTIELSKQSAITAIESNLNTYMTLGQKIPNKQSIGVHLNNTDFQNLLFAWVKVEVENVQEAA